MIEAIVDAKALREAALKNAETIVIEKYSTEVKKTLEDLTSPDQLEEIPEACHESLFLKRWQIKKLI